MIKPYPEAQVYAKPFYEKAGFHKVSDELLVDGIPHIKMIRQVRSTGGIAGCKDQLEK